MNHPLAFLVESYQSERLKTLTTWSEFADDDLSFRPAPLCRTPREQMVHQCVSEDGWMTRMLGIDVAMPALPPNENRQSFLAHYAEASRRRSEALAAKPLEWFGEETRFFEVPRSRAWVVTRRLTHSAHHRAQLTVYLRLLGRSLYSTYGPTADTGGLPVNGATVIYRYPSVERLLEAEAQGGDWPPLPGPGAASPTESP